MSPDITLENPCVGNEYFSSLWKLLLAFGLEDDDVDKTKGSIGPPKVRRVKDGSNVR